MAPRKKSAKNPAPLTIAFQGEPGAFSDIAARCVYPGAKTLPCPTFEDAFLAVSGGRADLAMIPIENTIAGRVADVHHLMPGSKLYIIGEHFQPIRQCLMGVTGAKLSDLRTVHSHVHALPQCRKVIKALKLQPVVHADTAGAAAEVARKNDKAQGAIASGLAAKIYGLKILKKDIQDNPDNVTRFVILSRENAMPRQGVRAITSFIFQVRHIPAALYKALGGFATNGVNMTKLESYLGEHFGGAEFYCEVEGHPKDRAMQLAFEELRFYASDIKIVGTYPAHAFRGSRKKAA